MLRACERRITLGTGEPSQLAALLSRTRLAVNHPGSVKPRVCQDRMELEQSCTEIPGKGFSSINAVSRRHRLVVTVS